MKLFTTLPKCCKFFPWSLLAVLFVGCTLPTVNPTPIATPRSSENPLPTVKFTAIISASATPSFSPTPTVTATSTQQPLPALPPILYPLSDYRLATPPVDMLLGLLTEANRQYWQSYDYQDTDDKYLLQSDAHSVEDAIIFAIRHYYPDGLPEAQQILSIDWSDYGPSTLDPELFTDGVFDYVKTIRLEGRKPLSGPSFTADVYSVELDGDSKSEWLLRIVSEKFYALTWLTLDEVDDGSYRQLGSDLTPDYMFFEDRAPFVLGVEDLTGDGRIDLIIAQDNYVWGTTFGFVEALRGTPNGFKSMTFVPTRSFALQEPTVHEVRQDESGKPFLYISHNNDINWGCFWKTEEFYRWPNGIERHTTTGSEPPDRPQCAVAQAVSLSKPPKNPTAIRSLESALKDFATDPPGEPEYELFIHYRLAILYALEGNESSARRHLEWLKNFYDTTLANKNVPYTQFVKESIAVELESPKINPVRLCDAMYSNTHLFVESLYYVQAIYAVKAYPLAPDPYPPAFCPLDDVLKQEASKLKIDIGKSPIDTFTKAGFTVVTGQHAPLTQGADSWIVVVELSRPRVLPVIDGQVGPTVHEFQPPTGPLLWLNEDLTGDNLKEVAFAYPVQPNYCQTGESAYDLIVAAPQTVASGSFVSGMVCLSTDQSFDLRTFLADTDGDKISDWVKSRLDSSRSNSTFISHDPSWLTFDELMALSQIPNETTSQSLTNLDKEFYESKNFVEVRQLLEKAREAVPTDDPNGPRAKQHLAYLIAFSYELEGRTEDAIQAYFDIWRSQPHTLWVNLAASHLERK